ncbi:hypothetical protein C8J55DRAFT_560482 [Lentinula edodes]|uniref:Uncharacterized protein n=1 Tax=Lentinula lateritia TaxID=40482 RepID=A0A9W9DPS0_9AGAR|nr:hypothetical protein C8J55DRAFT_560482 [Lentinula edodes]
MAGVVWADMRSAFQNLKTKTRRRHESKPAISKLSSILAKLESSSLDLPFVAETCVYFRKELTLLYQTFLLETLQFACALFDCIQSQKQSQKAIKNKFSILQSWEHVQKSILSGILDYLEETQDSDHEINKSIAEYMFPVLCRHFFPSDPSPNYEEIDFELKTTVYIILSDTVKNQKILQRRLRDPKLLGGARFGLEITRARAYLHLEALFELFEKLLPENPDECSLFVDSVFNPALFSRHQELKEMIASLKNQTWEDLFPKVVQTFAQMSVRFPQPISILNAKLSNNSPCPSETLFVDQRGLTYNKDVGDAIDTCHIVYHNIVKIRYSRYSQPSILTTTFNFELTAPPTVGKDVPEPEAVTLTVDVPRHERDDFLKALEARGLASRFDQTERKISLAVSDGPLNFSNQPEDPPQSFPEKSRQILKELTPSDTILVPSSSPILPKNVPTAQTLNVDLQEPTQGPGKPPKKGRKIVQSDDELEDEPSPKRKPIPLQNRTTEQAVVKSENKLPPHNESRKNVDHSSGKENDLLTKRNETPNLQSKKSGFKRKAPEIDKNTDRALKRARLDPELDSTSSAKTTRHARRYGRRDRGRTSSPPLAQDSPDDDLDSIPKPIIAKTTAKTVGVSRPGIVAAAMKGRTAKKDVTVPTTMMRPNAKGKAPQKTTTRPKHEPVTVEDAKPTRRSARVAGKQSLTFVLETNVDDQQAESVDEAQNEEQFRKASAKMNNSKEETRNPQSRPKAILNKKAPVENFEAHTVPKYTTPSCQEVESYPPLAPKAKKDKKAPWEMFEFNKQREDDTNFSPTNPDSVLEGLEEPTSGIDLPVQVLPFDDFDNGHIDLEIPLKVPGPDESSDSDNGPNPDLHRRPDPVGPEMIDLTMDSPSPKTANLFTNPSHDHQSKAANLPTTPSPSTEDPEPLKPTSELNPRRIHNPQMTENPRQKPPSHFLERDTPVAKETQILSSAPLVTPAVLTPLQVSKALALPRHTHFSDSEQVPSSLSKHADIDKVPLPHAHSKRGNGLALPKIFPTVASLAQTALDTQKHTQHSTPLRFAPKKTPLAPPSLKKRVHHQQHVAFSPLPQFPLEMNVLDGRWEPEKHDHVRKLRDAAKSNVDSVVGFAPQKRRADGGSIRDEKNAEISDIVEILHDIQEVLITKISNRFDSVKKEVRIGRNSILRAAAADIDKMRAESAEHFNAMVDLEAEYASFRRYVVQQLEDLCTIDKDVVGRLTEIVQHHDRHGLSKKFPKSLPAIPACFLNLN